MASANLLFAFSLTVLPAVAAQPDALEIVKQALALSRNADSTTRTYHVTQDVYDREFDDKGNVTNTKLKTYEHFSLYGEPFSRLIRRDGQPLSSSEEHSEQRKYEETKKAREAENPEQRRKRILEYEQKIDKRREMLDEVEHAFLFRHLRQEVLDGIDTWVIEAKPRPGYHPPSFKENFLIKMEGNLWISKQHHRLVKVDAVTTGPVSFGWFLAKLGAGTRISFEQVRVDDNVWLTKRFKVTYDMRIALVKRVHAETEHVLSSFRRIG